MKITLLILLKFTFPGITGGFLHPFISTISPHSCGLQLIKQNYQWVGWSYFKLHFQELCLLSTHNFETFPCSYFIEHWRLSSDLSSSCIEVPGPGLGLFLETGPEGWLVISNLGSTCSPVLPHSHMGGVQGIYFAHIIHKNKSTKSKPTNLCNRFLKEWLKKKGSWVTMNL